MTSNQLAYWRNEEEKRANRAKESETIRHNMSDEDIKRVSNEISKVRNELEAKGLELDKAANLAKIQETWARYGTFASNQLPDEARQEMYEALGINWKDLDPELTGGSTWFNQFWGELRNLFGDIGDFMGNAGKAVSALF